MRRRLHLESIRGDSGPIRLDDATSQGARPMEDRTTIRGFARWSGDGSCAARACSLCAAGGAACVDRPQAATDSRIE